jgi:hypothetical protein
MRYASYTLGQTGNLHERLACRLEPPVIRQAGLAIALRYFQVFLDCH